MILTTRQLPTMQRVYRWMFRKGEEGRKEYGRWRSRQRYTDKAYVERSREKCRRYQKSNRATVAAYRRKQNNFSKRSAIDYLRKSVTNAYDRARRKGLKFDSDLSNHLVVRFKPFCPSCGREYEPNTSGCRFGPLVPSIDKIDSTGGYTKDNVAVICWQCNLAKGEWPIEYLHSLGSGIHHTNGSVPATEAGGA